VSARAFSCMLAAASAMPTRVKKRIMSGLIGPPCRWCVVIERAA
jgi:hypothetical protein